jgi:hypothetical protein
MGKRIYLGCLILLILLILCCIAEYYSRDFSHDFEAYNSQFKLPLVRLDRNTLLKQMHCMGIRDVHQFYTVNCNTPDYTSSFAKTQYRLFGSHIPMDFEPNLSERLDSPSLM